MNDIIVRVDGFEFHAAARGAEPEVLDVDLAKRLGYARPRDVRKLIARLAIDGILNESDLRAAVARKSLAGKAGSSRVVDVTEYWLAESGALKVMAKSDTPNAIAGLDAMVRAFLAAKRMLAANAAPPSASSGAGFHAVLAACRTVSDNPAWKTELFQRMGYIAFRGKMSWGRVHGALRKYLGVVSYLRIPVSLLDETRRYLDSLATGAVLIPGKPAKLRSISATADPRQLGMPFASRP